MKRIKYSLLRLISVAVYLLTTVIFCIYLVKLGNREVKKAKQYATTEKQYVKKLLACRAAINRLEQSFYQLQRNGEKNVDLFIDDTENVRKISESLVALEKGRISRGFMPDSQLIPYTVLLDSVANAYKTDLQTSEDANATDRDFILNEDLNKIADTMNALREEVQERLNVELNYVENWQNQSLFFFERLEMLLVSFFVLATFFTIATFALSGFVLRKYLEKLSVGANQISSGNLEYRFNDTTTDVVGDVMRDFDVMAMRLQQQTELMERINRELKEKATELEEANLHKDKFLANMSHELRTPLNSIIGFSDLLIAKSDNLPPEKTRSYATRILSASEHLLSLISDLLEIAKVDAGVLVPEYEEFDIAAMIREVAEMLRPMADSKEIKINLDLPEKTVMSADTRLIKQVLINIMNNAIKYTKEGENTISLQETENEVIIKVKDTGIGISEKDAMLIFKDFHRVEQGLTSNYEGVGLGLTLSKRIIELHNGEITVQSELNKGSTFTVILPKEKNR